MECEMKCSIKTIFDGNFLVDCLYPMKFWFVASMAISIIPMIVCVYFIVKIATSSEYKRK